MDKINLADKLKHLDQPWFPAVVASFDRYDVKVVKLEGEFVWHAHDQDDEVFYVIEGAFDMHFRDRVVGLGEGDMIVVPKGIEHKPVAATSCSVIVIEKQGLVNTGNAPSSPLTRTTLPRI